jgi:hypothetical protein
MKITNIKPLYQVKAQVDNQAAPGLESWGAIVKLTGDKTEYVDCYNLIGNVMTLQEFDKFLSLRTFQESIAMRDFVKPSWLNAMQLPTPSTIDKYTENDYSIVSCEWLNFYFKFLSVVHHFHKKPLSYENPVFVFIAFNAESEWFEIKAFETQEQIDTFFQEYYNPERD